jgi:hypothetical protein
MITTAQKMWHTEDRRWRRAWEAVEEGSSVVGSVVRAAWGSGGEGGSSVVARRRGVDRAAWEAAGDGGTSVVCRGGGGFGTPWMGRS